MDSEKATAVSPGSSLSAPRRRRTRLASACGYDSSRRRSNPAEKRNGEDVPILSPSAAWYSFTPPQWPNMPPPLTPCQTWTARHVGQGAPNARCCVFPAPPLS